MVFVSEPLPVDSHYLQYACLAVMWMSAVLFDLVQVLVGRRPVRARFLERRGASLGDRPTLGTKPEITRWVIGDRYPQLMLVAFSLHNK